MKRRFYFKLPNGIRISRVSRSGIKGALNSMPKWVPRKLLQLENKSWSST